MNDVQSVMVVTGASRGIGLGVACLLAARRVPLVLTARGEPGIRRVGELLASDGAIVKVFACDAADEAGMAQVLESARSIGPLGGMLNNAGVLEPIEAIRNIDVAAFERHLRTNVTGVLVGIKQALLHRTAGHVLRVLNVSSGAASHGYRGWAAYCSSKAAVSLLTEVASEESADAQTSIVAVAPGVIETRMQRVIRETPAERFPDVGRFVTMKQAGMLLSPVDAAIALDWLLTSAPVSLSGQFVDARGDDVQQLVQAHTRDGGESYGNAVEAAKRRFDALESR